MDFVNKHNHTILLVLSLVVLAMSVYLVYYKKDASTTKASSSEYFTYSPATGQKLCAQQSQLMTRYRPFYGRKDVQQQAYANCIQDFQQSTGKNMPSAYYSATWNM